MRLSCNGCRVLRKGCSENCSIKPCLQWIKSSESQAHATVFLAKFYGRAGIINLINAGPHHLRPEIFRSLLYEACGRIVNPIYGSVGLLSSGKWQLCQDAVEAVLRGDPITQIATESAAINNGPPTLKSHDIRHVNKKDYSSSLNVIHRVRIRPSFKKSTVKKESTCGGCVGSGEDDGSGYGEANGSTSHDSSSLSHQSEAMVSNVEGENRDVEYLGCSVAVPAGVLRRKTAAAVEEKEQREERDGIRLELTLGF